MQRAESVGRAAADPFWVPRLPLSGGSTRTLRTRSEPLVHLDVRSTGR